VNYLQISKIPKCHYDGYGIVYTDERQVATNQMIGDGNIHGIINRRAGIFQKNPRLSPTDLYRSWRRKWRKIVRDIKREKRAAKRSVTEETHAQP
jgi:hypothetical protein